MKFAIIEFTSSYEAKRAIFGLKFMENLPHMRINLFNDQNICQFIPEVRKYYLNLFKI